MFLKTFRKINALRFVKKSQCLNSNYLKKTIIIKNNIISKALTKQYSKSSFFYKKKWFKKKNRIYFNVNFFKFLKNCKYSILCTKKSAYSDNIFGLLEIQKKIFLPYSLKKQLLFNDFLYKKYKGLKISGSFCFINLFWGFEMCRYYNINRVFLYKFNFFFTGSVTNLIFVPYGHVCYNVYNSFRNFFYGTSPGSFTTLLEHDVFRKTALIRLSSGVLKRLNLYEFCIVGRCANIYSKYRVFGKASNTFLFKKKKVSVRGIAMNPVDHPNGGRSKIKKPFLSPWGWVAKMGK